MIICMSTLNASFSSAGTASRHPCYGKENPQVNVTGKFVGGEREEKHENHTAFFRNASTRGTCTSKR